MAPTETKSAEHPAELRDYSRLGVRYLFDLLQNRGRSFSGYESNELFINAGTDRFVPAAAVLGADLLLDGRGVAYGDLDGDNDLDLVISNRNAPHLSVLRNTAPRHNHYLAVDVRGSRSNRMAIGARLTLTCDGRRQMREVTLGQGFMTQSTTTQWFGLGSCSRVESLRVRWPSGEARELRDLEVDRRLEVVEDEGEQTAGEVDVRAAPAAP